MTAPTPKKQRAAWSKLDDIYGDASNVWVIHYSCESFYDRPNGASPRITSLAVKKLDSGQTISFSIHQIAETEGVEFSQIDEHYDDLERKMLGAFYEHVGGHKGMRYLHWNMRDVNYGFAALEHRYRVLGGSPIILEDEKKVDLARLLIDIYGVGYTGHPRLQTLLAMNTIKPRDFLTGPEEAEAFETRNFVGLHQSTLRKVDILANLGERAHSRQLKTNTTWWEMHGGRVKGVVDWVADNKIIAFVIAIMGLLLAVYALKH